MEQMKLLSEDAYELLIAIFRHGNDRLEQRYANVALVKGQRNSINKWF